MPRTRFLPSIGLLLAASCGPDAPPVAPTPPPAAPREVSVAPVSDAVWERVLRLTGELVPAEQSTVSTKLAGRLEELAVDVGTRVTQGQMLARLEARDFELRLQQAAASLQAARALLGLDEEAQASTIDPEKTALVSEMRAALDQARREMARQQSLVSSGTATQSALENATTELSAAESRWQAAKETIATRQASLLQRQVEWEIAKQQLADTKVQAPYDGVVLERLAGRGDSLAAGAPIARMFRDDPLRLRLIVSEQESGLVREGQELRAHFDSGAPDMTARVTRFSPALGANARTLLIEADLPNPEGRLRPGSFVRAELVLDPEARAVSIPPAALVRFAGIDKVFVAENDTALERRVTVGRVEKERVEILEGLKVGETVVLDPGKLQTGARLQVRAKD